MSSDESDTGLLRRQRTTNKRKAQVADSESDGEAELHPTSASTSAAAAAASAADPQAQADEAEIQLYNDEGVGDAKDQAYLESLPEREREAIIYDRTEKRSQLIERRDARLRQQQAEASTDAQHATSTRKQTRSSQQKRTRNDKQAALADIAARRTGGRASKASDSVQLPDDDEQEDQLSQADDSGEAYEDEDDDDAAARRRKRARRQRDSRSASGAEDSDASYDADGGEDGEAAAVSASDSGAEHDELDALGNVVRRRSRRAKAEHESRRAAEKRTPLRLMDCVEIQLRRATIEKLIDEPYFKQFCCGMWARMSTQSDSGHQVYMLVRIVDIVPHASGVPYKLTNKQMCNVDAIVEAYNGDSKRQLLTNFSNHSIAQAEFDAYVRGYEAEVKRREDSGETELPPMQSREEAHEKRRAATNLQRHYVYSHEDTEALIAKNQARSRATMNRSAHKINLQIQIQRLQAEIRNKGPAHGADKFTPEQLEQAKADLESVQHKLAALDESEVPTHGGVGQASASTHGILALNSRNKQRDLELHRSVDEYERQRAAMLEQAQIEQRASGGTAQLTESIEALESADAFKRRATRPMMDVVGEEEADDLLDDKARKAKADAAKAEKEAKQRADREAAAQLKLKLADEKRRALALARRGHRQMIDADGDEVLSPVSDSHQTALEQLAAIDAALPSGSASAAARPLHGLVQLNSATGQASALYAACLVKLHSTRKIKLDDSALIAPHSAAAPAIKPYRLQFQKRFMSIPAKADSSSASGEGVRVITVDRYWIEREMQERQAELEAQAAEAQQHQRVSAR